MKPGDTSTDRYSVLIFVFTLHDPIIGGKAQQAWRNWMKGAVKKITRKYILQVIQFGEVSFNPEEDVDEQTITCTAYERSRRR